jgi:glycosyltransferase involved in cell wall biosynthesis
MKEKIISHFKLNPQKVEVVIPQSVLAGLSVSNEEKEKIKLQYADGKEYFLYAGDLDLRHQLLQLLKAFSLFKKRQRSTWKLVLAGTSSDAALVKMLETYKYKEDVVLLTISHLERSTLVAAAYAFITPAYSEGFTLATNDALQAGIAVLAPAESAAGDLLGEAGLLFNPNSPEDMADKMMWVYKNEAGRKELIQKGVAVAEQLADVPSIEQFWNAIMKTAST